MNHPYHNSISGLTNQQIIQNATSQKSLKLHKKTFANPFHIVVPWKFTSNYSNNKNVTQITQDYINACQFYEGPANNFDFDNMTSKYHQLQNSLAQFNCYLDKVYSARFPKRGIPIFDNTYNPPRIKTYNFSSPGRNMIVISNNDKIIWRVKATSGGSSQNVVYFNGKEIKLGEWLHMTSSEQLNYYNTVMA